MQGMGRVYDVCVWEEWDVRTGFLRNICIRWVYMVGLGLMGAWS